MHYIQSAQDCYNSVEAVSTKPEKLQKIFDGLDLLDHAEKESISAITVIRELRRRYIKKASEITENAI